MFFPYLCKQIIENTMATAVSINISLPRADLGFVRKLAKRMSWSIAEAEPKKLYDPETGQYFNKTTMKAISDVEEGKVKRCKNLDELISTI